MEEFVKKISEVYPLSEESLALLLNNSTIAQYEKGCLLIEAGKLERYSYIIVKGLARGFFYKEGKDVTMWFASPGMTLLSMNAYISGATGYENVELLEDSELLKISNDSLNRLFEENIGLANWGRRMSDRIIWKLEQAFMERNFEAAARRYQLFAEQNPEVMQKVPLRHIASYLGISQVSLSRIRAGQQ